MIYILVYKEEHILKLAKWDVKVLIEKLVRFDRDTINRVYIENQNKIIKLKNLQIFKNTLNKTYLALPDLNNKPAFNATETTNEQESFNKSNVCKNVKIRSKPP